MGRFTAIAEDAFDALQLEAGVLLSTFDPANPVAPQSSDIIATTTGGINPSCVATYSDLATDVDNVPLNMMEFNHLDSWQCTMGFSTIKFNAENTVWALGAADTIQGTGYTKIVPRRDVKLTDYKDVWWVGDKANGGAFAVKLLNALSTGGLSIQSTKNGKGTNAVTLTGYVSISSQNVMPMEFYDIEPDGTVTIYTVTQNLTNVTSSFTGTTVEENGTLTAELTADDGYTVDTVSVYMGGVDVTSTAYTEATNTVYINGVSGTVVITATATEE